MSLLLTRTVIHYNKVVDYWNVNTKLMTPQYTLIYRPHFLI